MHKGTEQKPKDEKQNYSPVEQPKIIKGLADAIPALNKLASYDTIGDYYSGELGSFLESVRLDKNNPSRERFLSIIGRNIERLYGTQKAEEVAQKAKMFPIFDGGIHLWFPYDCADSAAYSHQRILLDGALAKHFGQDTVVQLSTSSVAMNNKSSGGARYELVSSINFPTASCKIAQYGILFGQAPVKDQYFNKGALIVSQLKCLHDVIDDSTDDNKKFKQLIADILQPVFRKGDSGELIYKNSNGDSLFAVERSYDRLNKTRKKGIEEAIAIYAPKMKEMFGMDAIDMQREYEGMHDAMKNPQASSMADQAAMVQKYKYDKILSPAGLETIVVDSGEIIRDFLIEELTDPSTALHRIFADPGLRKGFVDSLAGIRSGWKSGMSPFVNVIHENEYIKLQNGRMYEEDDADPQKISMELRNGKIMPSTVMMVIATLFGGVLMHGGKFQSAYGTEARDRLTGWLGMNGFDAEAEKIGLIPTDFTARMQTVVYDEKTGLPATLGNLRMRGDDEKKEIVESISDLSSVKALVDFLPVLKANCEEADSQYVSYPENTKCGNDFNACPDLKAEKASCGVFNICCEAARRKLDHQNVMV